MRNSTVVVVPKEWGGRDGGKTFKITEWPAATAEKWGLRMVLVLKGTSAQIPEQLAAHGAVAIALRGLNSFLAADIDPDKMIPLLDEMLDCVEMIRDPAHPEIVTSLVSPDDIEEVATRGWLRSEVLRLHTNFSLVDAMLNWWATSKKSPEDSSTT